jgi:hypothetical protein
MSSSTVKARVKREEREHKIWLRGYRDGYEKGVLIGKRAGKEQLQADLRELLNVDRADNS